MKNQREIRVIFADDHPFLTTASRLIVEPIPHIRCVGEARNSTDLVELLQVTECDVLVTDYAMPGGNYGDGIALLSFLGRRYPALKIVVMTMLDNAVVLRSLLRQGIQCIVSKSDDPANLIQAIQAADSNQRFISPMAEELLRKTAATGSATPEEGTQTLSRRELEVVRLFASGMTISEIAALLRRTKQTISTQKLSAMRKLGVERDSDLFRYAVESGLTSGSGVADDASESTKPAGDQ